MPKINVLVTGVGAVIGQGIVKSLRMSGIKDINIIGADANPSAVGFLFCDDWLICPPADSDKFIEWVIDICDIRKIDLVLPGIPQDVYTFAMQSKYVRESINAILVLNSQAALDIGHDKWETYLFLRKNKIPAPETLLVKDIGKPALSFPCLLKTRKGSAGKGMKLVNNAEEYCFYSQRRSDFILQEYVGSDDEEYTCGIFGTGKGNHTDVITMKRKLGYGSTMEAVVDDHKEINKVVIRVAEELQVEGPTNIQIRMHYGVPMVIEVNPRFSSSNSLRSAFGFNEAEMCIRHFLFKEAVKPVIRKGFAQRYIEDIIVRKE